jgi:hypothetical protein
MNENEKQILQKVSMFLDAIRKGAINPYIKKSELGLLAIFADDELNKIINPTIGGMLDGGK